MTDTEISGLDPRERDTLPPSMPTTEEMLLQLEVSIAETNSAAIQAAHAAELARAAAERCSSRVIDLLQRIRENELRTADQDHRIYQLEKRVALLEARPT